MVLIVLGVAMLAGCGGVRRMPMTEQSRSVIERVAVARAAAPAGVSVNATSPVSPGLYGYGAIGGLVAGLLNASASNGATTRMNESLGGRNRQLGAWMTEALKIALVESGYQVREIEVRRKEPLAMVEDLQAISFDEDALLDVVVSEVGYSGPGGMHLRPWLSAQVRLVARSSGKTLYADEIYYADISGYADSPAIKPDAEFKFANLNALAEDPDRSLAVLKTGLELIAKRIGERMNRQNQGVVRSAAAPAK